MRARIPFTVIGGFLGAGKTTLLNHWLRQAAGARIAVLVNDFGELSIDAALVERRDADTIALANGCVCCSIGDDLSAALLRVLQAEPRFDAVVVEASGVADPWRIAQYAIAEPDLMLQAVLVMVDASAVHQQVADARLTATIERALAHADLVVLNKADLVSPQELASVRQWAALQAPGAPCLAAVQAEVPPELLLGAGHIERVGFVGRSAPSHGTQFEALSLCPQSRFEVEALRRWAGSLPAGVLRLKALLRAADGGWLELQFAGRRGSVRRHPDGGEAAAAFVAIGLQGELPVRALREGLDACAIDTG